MTNKRGITVEQAKRIRAEKGIKDTKLQRVRVSRGLSQIELAERSGVPVRSLPRYEQGIRPIDNAKLQTICKLCIALYCKFEYILENEETIKMLRAIR